VNTAYLLTQKRGEETSLLWVKSYPLRFTFGGLLSAIAEGKKVFVFSCLKSILNSTMYVSTGTHNPE
jgi:hypothetical protein